MADLVFNIRAAAASDVRNLSAHELHRAPDGNSAIDPKRSHLNRVLLGPRTQSEALEALFASGVQRPTAQAEAPYIQIVVGASGEFFRPDDPEAAGTFQTDRLEQFERKAMDWLKATFGDDLIHVSLHLDETTPHMHVLVAPTYEKAARKPGRKKRGETDADFEARKRESAARPTVRTVGRRSNVLLSAPNSFQTLRQSLADHLDPLGINYGNDLHPTDPDPQTTRQNLQKENQRLKAENQRLKAEAARTLSEARQQAETAQRATRAAQETQRAAESAREAAEAEAARTLSEARQQAAEMLHTASKFERAFKTLGKALEILLPEATVQKIRDLYRKLMKDQKPRPELAPAPSNQSGSSGPSL
ncbi:plasmid recombination protein [Pseudogemmobacter humi]|uniref:Plasmid recombination enzyme n=1 Tax=Pseudogemmobacter humi TaxID=2483812 RepID=A0A3P5WGP9_9RHOB|nr:plasmid recombination protein [Pseudogemmobacter humi]VDC18933.1 Plasmid recombination enzyme [Pseudogemmobacter humi]